jgi:tRNA pseudouridine(38-40) synthase
MVSDMERAVNDVNLQLPDDIHVYSMTPVTASFNAYQMCHGRKYEYFLPTFALLSHDEFSNFFPPSVAPAFPTAEDVWQEQGASGEEPSLKKPRIELVGSDGFERILVFRSVPKEIMESLEAYRIPHQNVARARELFKMFEGTKSFHNFTPGGRSQDPSSMRYIVSVSVDDPIEVEVETAGTKMEFVRIELNGQSFMLNQIRKMIGAVCSVMLSGLPNSYLSDLLCKEVHRGIPMAPANGLFLSNLDFSKYNLRLCRIQQEGENGKGKSAIHMDSVDPDQVTMLRSKILAVISRKEHQESICGRWMRSARNVIRLAWDLIVE